MKTSFLIGSVGYPLLELLYRGRTHYSMAIAGGLSSAVIAKICNKPLPLAVKAVGCGAAISGIELMCGWMWNREHKVWDYRNMPMNFSGQICLPFSVAWCGLSAALIPIYKYFIRDRT